MRSTKRASENHNPWRKRGTALATTHPIPGLTARPSFLRDVHRDARNVPDKSNVYSRRYPPLTPRVVMEGRFASAPLPPMRQSRLGVMGRLGQTILLGLVWLLLGAIGTAQQPNYPNTHDPRQVHPGAHRVSLRDGQERETYPATAPPTFTLPPLPPKETPSAGVQPASFTTNNLASPAGGSLTAESTTKRKGPTLKGKGAEGDGNVGRPNSSLGAIASVLFSLGIVISLFLALTWIYRKSQPQGNLKLSNELVQVLGRTSLSPRNSVYVLRFGNKLVLVSDQPGHSETLSEITDPAEVERLTKSLHSQPAKQPAISFTSVLRQVVGGA